MAQVNKTQKTLEFKDLFYIFKKNLIVEILIFVAVLIVGVLYTYMNTDYYMAQSHVVIKAEVTSGSEYNDTVLSKMYLTTVSSLLKKDPIVDRAKQIYGSDDIYAGNISVTYEEDNLLLDVFYKDYNDVKAKEKLEAILNACEDFSANAGAFPANIQVVNVSYETKVYSASDDRKIVILAGLAAVLCVGAYVILLYFVKDRVTSVERIESITGKKNFVTIEKKKNQGTPLPLGEGEVEASHIEIDLRKLSDTLIYMSDGENKVYQIQSGISGEGKTTVSTNLAKALGESQRKTLIIDCDFSKPSIHRIFKQHRHKGITDYFKGEMTFDEIVKPTNAENVDLITCGDRIANHTIFFASPKFKAIIEEAKTKYDFIILDCAPVKALSDYINISAVSDATLLVVGNDKLSARDLEYTVRELEACDANLIGTVFNFSAAQNKRHYSYYYYYKK
ncbi:MAG: polysaccharide biosynthesis tyrosine autokinase [Clostridiales bacterium]|nr:polysaccharide biosynthesis tyrosine autokinase [Clostridiales bacterium]